MSRRDWSRIGVTGALNTVAIYTGSGLQSHILFYLVSLNHLAVVKGLLEGLALSWCLPLWALALLLKE